MKLSVFMKRVRDLLIVDRRWSIGDLLGQDSSYNPETGLWETDWTACLLGGVAYVGLEDGVEELQKFVYSRKSEASVERLWPDAVHLLAETIREEFPDRIGRAKIPHKVVWKFNDHALTTLDDVEWVLLQSRRKALRAS